MKLIVCHQQAISKILALGLLASLWGCGASGGSSDNSSGKGSQAAISSQMAAQSSRATSTADATIAQIYQSNCNSCHGPEGKGGAGPAFDKLSLIQLQSGVARMPLSTPLNCGDINTTVCRDQLTDYIWNNFVNAASSSLPGTTSSLSSATSSNRSSISSNRNSSRNSSARSSTVSSNQTSSTGGTTAIASIYQSQCSSCHGANGEGSLGPALTGSYSLSYLKTALIRMPYNNIDSLDCGTLAANICRDQLAQYVYDVFAKKTVGDIANLYYAKARVRRLTTTEYYETLRALGVNNPETIPLPVDTKVNGYSTKSDQLEYNLVFAQSLWDNLENISQTLANQLYQNQSVSNSCPSNKSNWNANCARSILQTFAGKAYRRSPTSQELDELVAVYTAARGSGNFQSGLTRALQTVLQSPELIYRTELGNGNSAVVSLTNAEIASALAYLITAGPPDAELLATTNLNDASVRVAQAQRLFNTAGASKRLAHFASEWLQTSELFRVNPNPDLFPNWSSLRTSIEKEPGEFLAHAVVNENMTLKQIFTANWTIGGTDLRNFYGASSLGNNKLSLPENRLGLLTQAALMANFASPVDPSPVRRGKFIRTRIMCQNQLPPPDNLVPSPPDPDPGKTNRERWDDKTMKPGCVECHTNMNPIGYAFENYDSIGAYRTLDNNKPVDASGAIDMVGMSGSFANAIDFVHLVADSSQAYQCFAKNYLEYSLGANAENGATDLLLASEPDFLNGSISVKEMILAFVRSPKFIERIKE